MRLVFSQGVTLCWISSGVYTGYVPCIQWVMVDAANKWMPRTKSICMPVWPYWCLATLNVRDPFIYDAITQGDHLYDVLVDTWIKGPTCLTWKMSGPRTFSHSHTGCKA